MSTETKMREDHWRVCKLWLRGKPSLWWGIFPPHWDLDGSPLLAYHTHAQALREASSRADFAATPPVAQEDWAALDTMPVIAMLSSEPLGEENQ